MENKFYEIDLYISFNGNFHKSSSVFINPFNFHVIKIVEKDSLIGHTKIGSHKRVIFLDNYGDNDHFQTTVDELAYLESIGAITLVRKKK